MRILKPLGLLLAFAAPAVAVAQPQPRGGTPQDITVTGVRLQDYRDRLASCLARNCPPNEDADATLALAEALFLNGAYGEAREAVHNSLRRNRDRARGFPEPVSDLYRAHARISRHMGFDADALRSSHGILNALEAGLPAPDHRHFTARLELSEIQMMMGRHANARRELNNLIREARRVGREDVAAIAELRMLWFSWVADRYGQARSELIRISQSRDPARRIHAIGAKILLARIYRIDGDGARSDALLAEIGRGGASAHRRLLHSPPYQLDQQEARLEGDQDLMAGVNFGSTLHRVTDNYEDKWIDVGFWVGPDGRVSGLEIVRRGSSADWSDPLLESIRGRVYSTANEATYRLERYTFTANYDGITGTRIRRHSPRGRVEYLDLTTEDTPPPPAARAPAG
jgi:hypothetical protein